MALTQGERQAQRRAKALAEGKKDLAISSVKLEHHEPLKAALKALESGDAVLHKGSIVKPIQDKREEARLKAERDKALAEVERLKIAIGKAKAVNEAQQDSVARAELGRERAIKMAKEHNATAEKLKVELARFEGVLWGFYRKR